MITEKEDSEIEIRIPRVPNISIPVVFTIEDHKPRPKKFLQPNYFFRVVPPFDGISDLAIEYEATDEDIEFINKLCDRLDLPAKNPLIKIELLEHCIDLWEKDTGKGQIIPSERAQYLVKEHKINELWEIPENSARSNAIIEALYNQWKGRRERLKHPLLRRFWKSEFNTDQQLRIVFNPRGRERMRLRTSRKNDLDTYERVTSTQMRILKTQLEQLMTLLKAVGIRESVKKHVLELHIATFEQTRAEKLHQTYSRVNELLDNKILETSKDFRQSIKPPELPPPPPAPRPLVEPQLPIKRPRPEPEKKPHLTFELAMYCCSIIAEGEKVPGWPVVGQKPKPVTEGWRKTEEIVPETTVMVTNHSMEKKIKSRGRYMRGCKGIALDRHSVSTYGHTWNRFISLSGKIYDDEAEELKEYPDDDENESFAKLHKSLATNFKAFLKQRKMQTAH